MVQGLAVAFILISGALGAFRSHDTEKLLLEESEILDYISNDKQLAVKRANRKPVMFTHIHKSGGTSLCKMAQMAGERIPQPNKNCNYVGKWTDSFLGIEMPQYAKEHHHFTSCGERKKLWKWHGWTFAGIERYIDKGDFCNELLNIIILRHPTSRLESYLNYGAEKGWRHYEIGGEPDRKTLQKCLDHGECENVMHQHQIDNYITRTLAGPEASATDYRNLTISHLQLAKTQLEKYDHVVILEELNKLNELLNTLGWDLTEGDVVHGSHRNIVEKKFSFSSEAQRRLSKINDLDIKLYNWAKNMKNKVVVTS